MDGFRVVLRRLPDFLHPVHVLFLVNDDYRLDVGLSEALIDQVLNEELVVAHLCIVPEHVVPAT